MLYAIGLRDLSEHLLEKFYHPNFDHRYLGGPSVHVQTDRDIRFTLNALQSETNKSKQLALLEKLEGQILVLESVSYFSTQESEVLLTMIEAIKKEI